MLPKINTYEHWIPRRITLGTNPETKISIPLLEPREYLLEQIGIKYPAIGGAAPTAFSQVRFQVKDIRRKYVRFYDPIAVTNYTTPGVFENFALNAKPRNEQWLGAKAFNMLFAKRNAIEINVSNYLGAGNPLIVDVVLYGCYFLSRSEMYTDG